MFIPPVRAEITAFPDLEDVHPNVLVTVNVYVPGSRSDMVVLVPVPSVVNPPGLRVITQAPPDGKPLNTTLPVCFAHDVFVIVPITGAERPEPIANVRVVRAAAQGDPRGLLVVTVIVTFLLLSLFLGVYVNTNGVEVIKPGLAEPLPFSVIVTLVALPPNEPLMVTGVRPQVLPPEEPRLTVGPFTHPVPCPHTLKIKNKKR
jgi:hypothetical protein